MGLFPTWTGKISIPALAEAIVSIGGNRVYHTPTEEIAVKAQLFECQVSGHQELRTDLPEPFDYFYVRKKRARRKQLNRGVLILRQEVEDDTWPNEVELAWDDPSGLMSFFDSADKIAASWKKQFSFQVAEGEELGLRPPQMGALHSIIAHFSVGLNHDPATVVMPTGTGKTETMLASLAQGRPGALLVIVPSDALRTQISDKFRSFGILRKLGCLPQHAVNPKVAVIRSGVRTVEDARQLLDVSNVIVTLPNSIEASNAEAAAFLCDNCTELYIDEAHHLGATTWQRIRDRFLGKKIVQFTATPFRNDQKTLGGKIIFNYKLSDAQRDDYYKKIRLSTVEEFGEDSLRDRVIAEQAIKILRADRDEDGLDHLLMARAQSTPKAQDLLALYRELAPDLNPVAIYSGTGRKQINDAAFRALRSDGADGSKIVICVDMLGEGFDLPELKIAAVHDNHKSLAVTLQFIGRFTRHAPNVGDAAVVVNIADANAEKRLEELYAEGADWDQLISRLSEERIDEELELQDVIDGLKRGGDLHDKISLWNLRPSLSTQIFRTKCEEWEPLAFDSAYSKYADVWHSYDPESNILIVVAGQQAPVKWGGYEELIETTYDLLIAYWDKENDALFIHATDYDRMRATYVAGLIGGADANLQSGARIFNVLNNVELPLAKSLGSSRIGAISFTSYFGPNVTEGLASIEKSESELNHIACLGYEDGEKVLWGAAQKKAKIWQKKGGTIRDWLRWCDATYAKLLDDTGSESNITRDFLRPQKLDCPYSEAPIAIQWGEYLQSGFSNYLAVVFDGKEIPLFLADIEIVDSAEGKLLFAIFSDSRRSVFSFEIDPEAPRGYQYTQIEGPEIRFRVSKDKFRDFDEQVYVDPPIVRYADGTYSYNNFHVPFDLGAGEYPADMVEEWGWDGVDLNRESMGKEEDAGTVQHRTFERIRDEYSVIFNDDGSGEAADLVAIKDVSEAEIGLTLVHCKGAHEGRVSSDIRNLYAVCGQAQKSISVKHEGIKKLSVNLRRRHERWTDEGSSRLLKGDMKTLAYFVEKARKASIRFEVMIVQPGVSRTSLTPDMARLLATTELFLKRTTDAEFRVIGS